MGRPTAINRPLSKLIKKKQTGCRSMKNKKKRAKLAKKRKVLWKKLILPRIDDIDDLPAQPPPMMRSKSQPPKKRPLTGKQQRKLRKKMKHLTAPDANRMEGMKDVDVSPKDDESTSQKADEPPSKEGETKTGGDDDGQWEDDGDWEDVEMKEED